MLAKIHSVAVHGIDAIPVEIEVNCPGHGNIGTILVTPIRLQAATDYLLTPCVSSGSLISKGRYRS